MEAETATDNRQVIGAIIDRLVGPGRGRCKRLAAALGIPSRGVYDWPRLGRIPVERMPAVIDLARRLDVDVSAEELLGIAIEHDAPDRRERAA